MSKIKVGIVGVGSCAKSLVEGIQYYNENPEDKIGLMYEDIGGYKVHDIEFVLGFDIDKRKITTPEIKNLGEYKASIQLHKEISVEIDVDVVQE